MAVPSSSAAETSATAAFTQKLLIDKHVFYIESLDKNQSDLSYHLTSHLRMSGVYWGLTALCILGKQNALKREDLIDWVRSCWDEEAGAYAAHPMHDAHILYTLSAIQILATVNALDEIDVDRVSRFILSLQTSSGSFCGDRFGETDTRFSYCCISALSLLGKLNLLDEDLEGGKSRKEKAIEYIRRCKNFDGGFGSSVGSESHAGQVFVCVGALAILGRLEEVDVPSLAWWLSERQLPNGGLNGRPEKLEDVCYSFWALSALSVLNKLEWIDAEMLIAFILSAQDPDGGGIADRPGDMVDVFHTHFGIAGLSLLGYPGLVDLDPVYCMPAPVIEKMGLRKGWKALQRRTSYP